MGDDKKKKKSKKKKESDHPKAVELSDGHARESAKCEAGDPVDWDEPI